VVQVRTQLFQDGGWPPFWKTVKLQYLRNRFTDFDKIWHGDGHQPRAGNMPLNFQIFEKSKMATAAILKITKIARSLQRFDRSSRNLAW